jgi:hypothetical protein
VTPLILAGATCEDVYGQLLIQFEDEPDKSLRGLTCVIEEGASALVVPPQFPSLDGVEDTASWFNDVVDWWQSPDPDLEGRSRSFNHGQRIRKARNGSDQVGQVIQALGKSPGTTRGIIQLIDQETDEIGDPDQRIPSFFSVHFLQDVSTSTLHCIGYFRKQEMLMWWPVNVGEIARLQAEVVTGLAVKGLNYAPGSITTVAGVAVRGRGRPRVVVPLVDRLAQNHPDTLWGVAYDLVFAPSSGSCDAFVRYFEDWRPTGNVEPDGTALSLSGLRTLSTAIELFATRADDAEARILSRKVNDLYVENDRYADSEERVQEPITRMQEYDHWCTRVGRLFEDIDEILQQMVEAKSQTEASTGT